MRALFVAAVMSLAIITNGAAHADTPTDKVEQFRSFLKEFRRENLVLSFSVAVVKDGK